MSLKIVSSYKIRIHSCAIESYQFLSHLFRFEDIQKILILDFVQKYMIPKSGRFSENIFLQLLIGTQRRIRSLIFVRRSQHGMNLDNEIIFFAKSSIFGSKGYFAANGTNDISS